MTHISPAARFWIGIRSRLNVLIPVLSGVAMASAYSTMLNVPNADIIDALDTDRYRIHWISGSYVLGSALGMALTKYSASRIGLRAAFLLGVLLFTLAGGACGLVDVTVAMAPLRWLNGIGNGLLLAAGMVLVWEVFPRHRDLAMALYGMSVFVPAAAGSVIGGLLTAWQSWRWIFLINLPAGAIVFSVAWSLLPRPANQQPRALIKFDLVGVGFLLASIVTATVVLDLGQYWGWATSREFSLWFVGFLAAIASFICWGLFASKPLFDFSVFRRRNTTLGLLIKIIFSINFYALATMLSVYMIDLRGYQWWQAGLVMLPAVVSMLAANLFGILLGEESNRRVRMFVGLTIMILSTWHLTVLDLYTSKFWLAGVLGVWGCGAGLVVGPALATIFGGLTIDETTTLAGIFNICRALPGYMATIALVTLWTQSTDAHFDTLRQNVRFNRPIVSSTYDSTQSRFIDRGSSRDQSLDQSHALVAKWTHANARAFALEDVLGDLALITSPALICVLLVRSPRRCHVAPRVARTVRAA